MNSYRGDNIKVVSAVVFFVLLSLLGIPISYAENYIGIILDGYEKDCIVSRNGRDYDCMTSRRLYAGDKVTKKPDIQALKIKWAPYTNARELDEMSMVVVFEPPKDRKGIVEVMREFLGFVRTSHRVSVGATRSGFVEVILQPGNNATLLRGKKSTFTWESDGGKFIVFKDSKSTEIFKKKLKDESFLELSPEEIGLKPREVYTWSIGGARNEKQFKIRLLSEDVARQVIGDLQKIEKEATDNIDKLSQTALYLQFLSDAYPNDIDLYWLSYRVLEGIEDKINLKEDEKALFRDLRKNYLVHAGKEI